MPFQKIFFLLVFLGAGLLICPGQELGAEQPEENWLRSYGIHSEQRMYFRYDRYSKEDTEKLREKLSQIRDSRSENEWEGTFYFGPEETVGYSLFRINFDRGFAKVYIYTCLPELQYFSYGSVVNNPDNLEFVPEFITGSKSLKNSKYAKVRWGDRLYLVEESSLLAFAEKAVGRFVENESEESDDAYDWRSFWVQGDLEKPLQGLPQFPLSYKKFERLPINGKLLSVGKRVIRKESWDENNSYSAESASYSVTINAGLNKGVKKGMIFEVNHSGEILTIKKVYSKSAAGTVTRLLNEVKADHCWDENSNDIPCTRILPGMSIRTQIGLFNL
jgi:hypothetical protein